jgi:IS30 family transposase
VVESRNRIGDIEVDLMIGKQNGSPLLVMTDRATFITTLDKLKSKNADDIAAIINEKIDRSGSSWIKTMTFDNGKEFARYAKLRDHGNVKTFFARPYTSQDKGTVENRIGLIRRSLPKGCDLNNISDKRIAEVEKMINNRKVKKFGYHTPL